MDNEKQKDIWSAIQKDIHDLQIWRAGVEFKLALLIAVGVAIGSTVLIAVVTALTNLVIN